MGVNQTSELYKGFIFDGIDSKGFGVYITGSGVYNAPEREIEAIEIPGRNGAYMLDRGRFHNVTVTYPAGMFARDGEDFADGIRKLRNALASRRGYCKLIDEYNPLEYRMAVYRGGLEVEPAAINGDNKAAQFEIQFDCKPQRFRIDGDQPVKMTDGGVIDNPTLFEARPLLQVWGHGVIGINGETISIDDAVIGDVLLANRMTSSDGIITFSEAQLRAGDDIRMGVSNVVANGFTEVGSTISNPSIIRTEGTIIKNATLDVGTERQIRLRLTLYQNAFESQDPTTKTAQVDIGYNYTPSGGSVQDYVVSCRVQIKYTTGKIEVTALFMSTIDVEFENEPYYETGNVKGYSTKSVLGEPLYFDMDIGEAYKIEGGELISVNNAVTMPAELPVLKPGANTITLGPNITELDIVPRWWEV